MDGEDNRRPATTPARDGPDEPRRWQEPWWLDGASPEQRDAWAALQECGIMEELRRWNPVLAGTVPLGLQVPGSDLDVLCEVRADEFAELAKTLKRRYGGHPGFEISVRTVRETPRLVARFTAREWPIEVFGQPVPVRLQNGFRHMAVEQRLVELYGEAFRKEVIRLKTIGIKTEPAFALLLGLEGDPYAALLELEASSPD